MDGAPTSTSSQLHLGLRSRKETVAGARPPKSAAQHRSRLRAQPCQLKHDAGEHGQLLMQLESIPTRGISRAAQPCTRYGLCCGPSAGQAARLGPLLKSAVPHPRGTISQQPRKQLCHLQPCGGNLAGSCGQEAGFGPSGVLHGSHPPSPSKEGAIPSPPAPQNHLFGSHTHIRSWRNNNSPCPEAGALPRASSPSSYPFPWERPLAPQTSLPTPKSSCPPPNHPAHP